MSCDPRYLGLDYGDASVGVAVACPRGVVATGVETIRRDDPLAMKPLIARLRGLITEYGITHVVLGYPRHMDGNASARCVKTEDFAARLKRNFKRLCIEYWDERMSTLAVTRSHTPARHVDEMAAVYILQGYLDHKNNKAREANKMNEEMGEQLLMVDDEGNEQPFDILASKESDGIVYLLAVEASQTETGGEDDEAEIVHFKCVATEGDDMVFELVDDDHEDFERVMELFKDDYEALEIIIED
jgi:putative Holliday junction resolvase